MATAFTPTKLITVDEFQNLEFDEPVELVRGEIVEMTRPGARHGKLCLRIGSALETWSTQSGRYEAIGNDSGVITSRHPDTVRGPDVLVIRKEKLPDQKVPVGWLTVPPDLCVEVLSPHDQWPLVLDKTAEYLAAGVVEVWLVDPDEQAVHVYRADMAPRIVRGNDLLATETLLPGFSISSSQLFAGI
ncbi:Uma2 family endonuclease [Planctomicrobium piriforme]|uniref:Endonuclease, Uma2 family (Restriction endonuclease fold) n=1 Tax=Planctomicrobium piriforme TaxID=1576369 RepID=A0A1I3ASU7_9PLAN|nr:Uma2 family endonuclease [Planctomicrobium piriforme]SFH53157.1 Endonuclease, Uma2 family (restriction endonuclease fold) [Planctomicrobium piriforme]